ncbi:cilia- and flagella- associated protein 210 [Rhineura floridana]|uniref:cilia- and flagella- associated protein 210 n=1 Tax=Rhineura floridana TaxID=261503 RepID=UPI002AC819EE|nr:cilia- and flagella- associated protein 210 [Rhineura floridana]
MGAVVRPVVRFGRRKGQDREPTPNEDDVLEGIFLPVGVDLRQITILSKKEWERIQDRLTAPAREVARIQAERKARKDLHLKSQALVKNWSNTIAGMSQGKLEAKKVRQQRDEEERRKIDLEEAKYQAQKRKEAIEQAKLYQYYQNERVKGFHRALLLTEVLKERDAQIEFKKIKENLYRSKDEEIECERQKAILREQEKAREHHMKRMQLSKEQMEQIKEHECLAELSRLEDKRERKEIQAQVRLHQLEMQEKELEEREEKLKRRQAHQAHVADQVTLKAIEKQKQEEEDEKVGAHFKAKQAMAKLTKAKEEEMLRLMEKQRDNITNRLLAQMKKKSDDEDERIARDVAEAEEELEREHKAKEEKNNNDLKSIKEHRINVIKMKEEKEKQEKLEAQEILHGLMEADRIYQELEKDKKHRNHCANLKLQDSHVMQIAEKMAREEREKQEDTEYVKQKELIALFKEQEFQQYANKVIDEESKNTRNLYPLLKSLNEAHAGVNRPVFRENNQPCDKHATKLPYIGDTAQEMKLLNEHEYVHTKGRLGFTW